MYILIYIFHVWLFSLHMTLECIITVAVFLLYHIVSFVLSCIYFVMSVVFACVCVCVCCLMKMLTCLTIRQIQDLWNVCVSVALVIQHTKRMCRIILSSVACSALPYLFTLSHKWHDFRKRVTGHKMCVLISSATFVWNISHSKKNWVRYYHKWT
jgi:hypothetical protein